MSIGSVNRLPPQAYSIPISSGDLEKIAHDMKQGTSERFERQLLFMARVAGSLLSESTEVNNRYKSVPDHLKSISLKHTIEIETTCQHQKKFKRLKENLSAYRTLYLKTRKSNLEIKIAHLKCEIGLLFHTFIGHRTLFKMNRGLKQDLTCYGILFRARQLEENVQKLLKSVGEGYLEALPSTLEKGKKAEASSASHKSSLQDKVMEEPVISLAHEMVAIKEAIIVFHEYLSEGKNQALIKAALEIKRHQREEEDIEGRVSCYQLFTDIFSFYKQRLTQAKNKLEQLRAAHYNRIQEIQASIKKAPNPDSRMEMNNLIRYWDSATERATRADTFLAQCSTLLTFNGDLKSEFKLEEFGEVYQKSFELLKEFEALNEDVHLANSIVDDNKTYEKQDKARHLKEILPKYEKLKEKMEALQIPESGEDRVSLTELTKMTNDDALSHLHLIKQYRDSLEQAQLAHELEILNTRHTFKTIDKEIKKIDQVFIERTAWLRPAATSADAALPEDSAEPIITIPLDMPRRPSQKSGLLSRFIPSFSTPSPSETNYPATFSTMSADSKARADASLRSLQAAFDEQEIKLTETETEGEGENAWMDLDYEKEKPSQEDESSSSAQQEVHTAVAVGAGAGAAAFKQRPRRDDML